MSSTNGTDTTPHYRTIFDMSPAEIEVLKQDVAGYLNGLRAAHLGWAAITTLLMWDILRTMDKEIHYVWKSRWSYAKVIFLVNRYLAPIAFLLEAILLFRTPSSFNINQCMIPQWFWIILCTLTVSTVSFVLGSRVWAIYERDRRVLFGLLVWFMACFVPSWTLTFLAGVRGGYDEDEIRVFTNVWQYIGGIVVQDGLDGLDWRLRKCYRFHFLKVSSSILIGSLAYETGICAAMIWRMYHDKKKTRIIEAFYRDGVAYYLVMLCTYASAIGLSFAFKNPIAQGFLTCAWYAAVKSMICSHIILRLRSYFTEGDPIVDGHDPADPFQGQLEGKQYDTSSSLVSTTIHFAHPIARSGGDVVLELRSLPSANSIQPARHIQDTVLDENKDEFPVTSTVLSSPRSRLQQVLDWTDGPDPLRRCSILGQPSSWNQAGDIGPLAERQLRRLHKQAESSGSEQNGRQRFAPSRDHTRLLSARSLQELQPAVRRGDMTRVSSSAAPRRTTSHANRPVGNDSAPLSTAKSQNLPSKGASSVVQVDVRQVRSDHPLPASDLTEGNER